jgi:phage tail P2-like protein
MSTMQETTLLELIPENLRHDPDAIAACKALEPEYQELVTNIGKIAAIVDIDKAFSELLDYLAIERNVEFYDQSLPIEVKRSLVKNARIYKMYKGTPYAVEQLLHDVFKGKVEIDEWFNYGDDPFYFRLITHAFIPDTELLSSVYRAINAVKNIRSKLREVFLIYQEANIPTYIGIATHRMTRYVVSQVQGKYSLGIPGVVYELD